MGDTVLRKDEADVSLGSGLWESGAEGGRVGSSEEKLGK